MRHLTIQMKASLFRLLGKPIYFIELLPTRGHTTNNFSWLLCSFMVWLDWQWQWQWWWWWWQWQQRMLVGGVSIFEHFSILTFARRSAPNTPDRCSERWTEKQTAVTASILVCIALMSGIVSRMHDLFIFFFSSRMNVCTYPLVLTSC